jgi:hypothetical protein
MGKLGSWWLVNGRFHFDHWAPLRTSRCIKIIILAYVFSGDIFLHRLVEILPRFRSKRQVVEISQQIESDVSAYLVTITIMNAAVGIATALAQLSLLAASGNDFGGVKA